MQRPPTGMQRPPTRMQRPPTGIRLPSIHSMESNQYLLSFEQAVEIGRARDTLIATTKTGVKKWDPRRWSDDVDISRRLRVWRVNLPHWGGSLIQPRTREQC
ncbi:unnamed protein product [Heterotrigona itama]|uniref:Uncharacterized protein n=1 Tax=Heterotrigona itama TaxID=395501 RepID=A0A6V7HJ74_9HYME|nr:unnamed protein product [Heterotrigona itama]